MIFWLDKDGFDLEYGDKEITTAKILSFGTYEEVQEFYDGASSHVIEYLEYSYYVNGKEYKYGSKYFGDEYSISDKIEIEYVKTNPKISKIKGSEEYSSNYFLRNLIPVIAFSLLFMFAFISAIEPILKSKRFNYWINKMLFKRKLKLASQYRDERVINMISDIYYKDEQRANDMLDKIIDENDSKN